MNTQTRPPIFSTKLVFGLTVIALGLIFLADSMRWYDAWHLLTWWPLVLAAFGLARLAQDGILTLRAIFPQPKRLKKAKAGLPSPTPADSCDPGTDATQVKP